MMKNHIHEALILEPNFKVNVSLRDLEQEKPLDSRSKMIISFKKWFRPSWRADLRMD